MAAEVPAPNYPTPDYGSFASVLGNLANTYRSGQAQNMDLDARKAFMDGFPTNAQGQPDWAKALQVYAQKGGDIRNTYNLAELAATQGQQQQLQSTLSSVMGSGGAGGYGQPAPQPTGDIPPASAGRAQPSLPSGAGGGYAEPMRAGVQPPRGAGFNDAIQDLQQDAEDQGISTEMISGQRDSAKQAKLRANMEAGRAGKPLPYPELGAVAVAAEPGQSPHEQGIAADVVAGGGQQQRLIDMAREPWRNIKPGADFGDPNHFEAAGGARSAQVAQAGGSQPLVPGPTLLFGATNQKENIQEIDKRLLRLSTMTNPPAPPAMIKYLEGVRQQAVDAITPMKLGMYDQFVDPQNPQNVIAKGAMAGAGAGLAPQALDAAAENYFQTGKLPPGMGRGIQGSQMMNAIISRASEMHPDADWSERPQAWQGFAGAAAGQRLLATRTASLSLAENEAKSLIPRVHEASQAVNRTQYPTLNKVIEAAKTGTGDQNVIKLGIAVESLAQTYARVLSPVGAPTAADKANAHEIWDKAWSTGQIDAALDQRQKEIASAKSSLATTRKEMGAPALKEEDAPAQAAPKAATSAIPDGWKVEVH